MYHMVRKIKEKYYLYKVEYSRLLGKKLQKLLGNREIIE